MANICKVLGINKQSKENVDDKKNNSKQKTACS